MIKSAKKRAAALGVMLVVSAVSGYVVRAARADGIPDTDVLTYAGTLEDNAGAPLSGLKNIQVSVYPDGSSAPSVCKSVGATQNVIAGRFEVKMPADCVTAMKGNPNAHVEVVVDGTSLGKSRIGAVPFAIEAGNAQKAKEADSATNASNAVGPLAAQVAGLATKADVAALETGRLVGKIGSKLYSVGLTLLPDFSRSAPA